MSENEEPVGPRRVIGTPAPAPVAVDTEKAPEKPPIVVDPPDMRSAKNAERLVAALFVLAFIAGCGFIAAFVGLEVGGATSGNVVDAVFRSNLALGLSLSAAPLTLAPLVLLRDMGPQPATSLRFTVWRKGLRAVTLGGNRPLRPADFTTPGTMITMIPEGFQDNAEALAKAGVILIKFAPGELHIPTNYDGGTLVSTMNWTIDRSIVAYSKICTHVGCPVALYEQTTHHILCPCHQST